MPQHIWRGFALGLIGAVAFCAAAYYEWGLVPALVVVGGVFLTAGVIVAYWSAPGRE